MAVRGEYSEAETSMLELNNRRADEMTGWAKFPDNIANEQSMRDMAFSVDKWNPLWRDREYARNTRWGGLIAFPMYEGSFGSETLGGLVAPSELGYQHPIWIGEDWEFFKPVHVNDSFKVWRRRPKIEDVTRMDGKGPRTLALTVYDHDQINQKDEVVSSAKSYVERSFLPTPPVPYNMPEYGYSLQEFRFLYDLIRGEEIRGAKIRWWEDVQIGEEPKSTVLGPTLASDNAIFNAALPAFDVVSDTRVAFLKGMGGKEPASDEILKDTETGLYHVRGGPAGRHWSHYGARFEGEPRAFLFAVLSRYLMTRCLTNWMGDDGFITKLKWRHINRNPIGDAVFTRARVISKRVENGEHLVNFQVWVKNLRGNTTEAGVATVRLLSRESKDSPFKWG